MRLILSILTLVVVVVGCASAVPYDEMSDEKLRTAADAAIRVILCESDPAMRGPVMPVLFGNQSELAKMGPRAVPRIVNALKDASVRTRRRLIETLGAIDGPKAKAELVRLMKEDPKVSVRYECAVVLGRRADPAALENLFKIVKKNIKHDRRARAIAALSSYAGEEKVVAFIKDFIEDDAPVTLVQNVPWGIFPFYGTSWEVEPCRIGDFAIAALARLTGRDFGYTHGDGAKARTAAIAAWRQYFKENK